MNQMARNPVQGRCNRTKFIFYSSGNGGKLAVGTFFNFGLNIGLDVQGKGHHRTLESANVGTVRHPLFRPILNIVAYIFTK